jgi:ribosomal protein L7Ae-like RNA K-turn-binding protein
LAEDLESNKIYSLLGLCMRAGKLKSGEFATMEAIRKKTAELVIVSCDASQNTVKQFSDKCKYYEVPIAFFGDKESLGHAIGKDVRTSLAITDSGLAESLRKNLLDVENGGNVNGKN